MQFLGVWYAIQKTSTASECVIYNISQVEPGQYLIQQLSQDYLIGLAPVSHRYSYTGELEVKDNDVPAKMTVKFPLNVLPGDAIFKIFMTDYGKLQTKDQKSNIFCNKDFFFYFRKLRRNLHLPEASNCSPSISHNSFTYKGFGKSLHW